MNPDGLLVLGSAETVESGDLFRVEDKKLCFYRKRNVPAREPRLPVFPFTRGRAVRESITGAEIIPETVSYGNVHQLMVEQYAPPSILISPDDKIVHFSEHAGRYLIHPGGEPTSSVLKLARPELRIELQASLRTAREKKQSYDSRPIPVRFNGHPCPVVMHIRPALEKDREGFALVIFEEREPRQESELAEAPSESVRGPIQELEAELQLAQQRLQAVIEEYESSREEMKASSEEMLSTNEELRSTMEELETSKEELQSINEELQTVNQQNRHKVEELAQLTSDLQNLLTATDIGTLFLDRELRILRFTPKLSYLFNARLTDRGRPISDLTHRLGYAELREDAEMVLSRTTPIEREVQDDSGRWYLTRVLPYRGAENRIDGVVITFIDIDKLKRAEEALRQSEERLRRLVNVEGVGVLIFDASGTLIDCNEAFLTLSGYTRADVAAKTLHWRTMTPSEYMAETEMRMRKLAETGYIGPYEKEYILKDGSRLWMIFAGANLGDGTLGEFCIDISARKRAEAQALKADASLGIASEALLRVNSDLTHFSYAVSHDMQEPLRMVTSYTQLLARDYGDKLDNQAKHYIDVAVEGAQRMESLLNGLREYWSVDKAQPEEKFGPCDLDAILDHAVKFIQPMIQENGATITRDPANGDGRGISATIAVSESACKCN